MDAIETQTAPVEGADQTSSGSPEVRSEETGNTVETSEKGTDSTATAEGQGVEGESKTDGRPEKPKIEIPKDRQKDFERIAMIAFPNAKKHIASLEDEVVSLKQQIADFANRDPIRASRTEGIDDDPLKHPAVKGLRVDEDGFVDYHGTLLHPNTVIAMHEERAEMQGKLDKALDLLESRGRAESEAAEAARVREAEDGITETISSTVKEMLPTVFPNLPEAKSALLTKRVLNDSQDNFADLIEDAKRHGELSLENLPELVQQSIAKAFEENWELYGDAYVERQHKHNEDYEKQHPVRPGGTTGTSAPKKAVTPAERDRLARETAERFMKQIG